MCWEGIKRKAGTYFIQVAEGVVVVLKRIAAQTKLVPDSLNLLDLQPYTLPDPATHS